MSMARRDAYNWYTLKYCVRRMWVGRQREHARMSTDRWPGCNAVVHIGHESIARQHTRARSQAQPKRLQSAHVEPAAAPSQLPDRSSVAAQEAHVTGTGIHTTAEHGGGVRQPDIRERSQAPSTEPLAASSNCGGQPLRRASPCNVGQVGCAAVLHAVRAANDVACGLVDRAVAGDWRAIKRLALEAGSRHALRQRIGEHAGRV